jgi:hypothetical protein
VAFILGENREKKKHFFDRYAFSWDKKLGHEDRTSEIEQAV